MTKDVGTQSDSELRSKPEVIKSVTQAKLLPDFVHVLAKKMEDDIKVEKEV